MASLDWARLVKEHTDWHNKNFDVMTLPQCVFGVMEEVGELAHHHLKEQQNVRGDAAFHQKEARDAVGDISIFMLGIMHLWHDQPGNWSAMAARNSDEALMRIGHSLANLTEAVRCGHGSYGIVDNFTMRIEAYCLCRGWSYEQIVTDTWNHVSKRDWRENPLDGGRVANG